jgi:hypothetical protein
MVARNVSDWKDAIQFQMSSPLLVSIDPLVLDGISPELQKLSPSEVAASPELIRGLQGPMKVGLHRIEGFVSGTYRIANDDLETVDSDQGDVGAFDIDTGTLILVDLSYLARLAQILTWEKYDLALQSPVGDDSCWLRVVEELGGPFFGILFSDINTPFSGDGTYRIMSGAPHRTA